MKKNKLRYPKLLLLIATFVLAYILFYENSFMPFHEAVASAGYLGTFLAGIFFVYGFTAAPATALLIILAEEQNIVLACVIAGIGSLIGDFIIFKLIKHSFGDELRRFSREKIIRRIHGGLPRSIKKYFLWTLAGFIIASPLPDEIGISLLAGSQKISPKAFAFFSFILNTLGILVILWIGKSI